MSHAHRKPCGQGYLDVRHHILIDTKRIMTLGIRSRRKSVANRCDGLAHRARQNQQCDETTCVSDTKTLRRPLASCGHGAHLESAENSTNSKWAFTLSLTAMSAAAKLRQLRYNWCATIPGFSLPFICGPGREHTSKVALSVRAALTTTSPIFERQSPP
ncbi:hypothetical protein BHM03_00056667 [Ensete ventricosum]|nr:hypothetical protein BHM03_00056667 [Ensete ventricosum]